MAKPRTTDSYRSQVGAFAMIPVWLLERCQDARAIYLYAVLGKYANREGRAWPSPEELSSVMGMSVRSLERWITILRDCGALKTEVRRNVRGSVTGRDFILVQVNPANDPLPAKNGSQEAREIPSPQTAKNGSQSDAALNDSVGSQAEPLTATDGTDPLPKMAVILKEEPDPLNQIHKEREAAAPLASPEDLLAAWNALTGPPAGPIPKCIALTPKRRHHAAARLREHALDHWRTVITRIAASAFCRGENGRGWTATFDWLVGSTDTGVKVLEGAYDDREPALTQAELAEATRLRNVAYIGCPHDPPCEGYDACVRAIAFHRRGRSIAS